MQFLLRMDVRFVQLLSGAVSTSAPADRGRGRRAPRYGDGFVEPGSAFICTGGIATA